MKRTNITITEEDYIYIKKHYIDISKLLRGVIADMKQGKGAWSFGTR